MCCAVPGVPSYAVPLRLSRAMTSGRLHPASSASVATRPGPGPATSQGSGHRGLDWASSLMGRFTAGSHHIFTLGPSTIKVTIINHALFKSHSSPRATRDTCHGC